MSWERWNAVDEYTAGLLIGPRPGARAARSRPAPRRDCRRSRSRPTRASCCTCSLRIHGARSILELGTLGATARSGWPGRCRRRRPPDLAGARPRLRAGRGRERRAGPASPSLVEIRVGPALDSPARAARRGCRAVRPGLHRRRQAAARPSTSRFALELTRPGRLILIDNVVRDGELADPDSADAGAQGMRRFLDCSPRRGEPRVSATTIQTVGSKGYDGFTLALRRATSCALPPTPTGRLAAGEDVRRRCGARAT